MRRRDSDLLVAGVAMVLGAFAVAYGLTECDKQHAGASPLKIKFESVLATGFAYPGDKWAGEKFFCLNRKVDHRTPGVAHRWRRCGSRVRITNRRTGRSTFARVIDRGPYWLVPIICSRDARDRRGFRHASHKCWARGRVATRRERIDALRGKPPRPGWVYANHVDMTPPIRRAIGHNGKEPVDLVWQ